MNVYYFLIIQVAVFWIGWFTHYWYRRNTQIDRELKELSSKSLNQIIFEEEENKYDKL